MDLSTTWATNMPLGSRRPDSTATHSNLSSSMGCESPKPSVAAFNWSIGTQVT